MIGVALRILHHNHDAALRPHEAHDAGVDQVYLGHVFSPFELVIHLPNVNQRRRLSTPPRLSMAGPWREGRAGLLAAPTPRRRRQRGDRAAQWTARERPHPPP